MPECTLEEECGVYVVVEHNGDVFACDFFVEPDWKLGNLTENDQLIAMLNSERQTAFGQQKACLPEACLACEWREHCRGGCTKDRIKDPRDHKVSHFCAAYRMFFDHADERLNQLAEKWKADRTRETERERVVQEAAESGAKVGRNDPCPCGSGKKFKRCCGD